MLRSRRLAAVLAVVGLLATACNASPGGSAGLTKVKVQK